MKINTSGLLAVIEQQPALFLAAIKLSVTNPSVIKDAIAASKSGDWLAFLETQLPTLLPFLGQIVTTMESDPKLTQEMLSAVIAAVNAAMGGS